MQNQTTKMIVVAPGESGNIQQYKPDDLSAHWLKYFDPQTALDEVMSHVGSLPGQRENRKSHTERAYRDGLAYALRFLGADVGRDLVLPAGCWFAMPTRAQVKELIGHLFGERGLSASTVNAKYLAPMRHFLRALAGQTPMPNGADEYMLIGMIRDELREAVAVRGPRKETTSNEAALWREGTRLDTQQVNRVLRAIDRDTLDGLRDYALLSVAFYTGLRRAELAQISLKRIKREGSVYTVTVMGKRSNVDPVTLPLPAYEAVMAWVEAYNNSLDPDDPRRIVGDVPVWQALLKGGNRFEASHPRFYPERGMTPSSLRNVLKRRVEGVIDGVAFSAHDARRTLAAILHKEGALVNTIQKVLRHKSAAVTLDYIGEPPDYAARDASVYVKFG